MPWKCPVSGGNAPQPGSVIAAGQGMRGPYGDMARFRMQKPATNGRALILRQLSAEDTLCECQRTAHGSSQLVA